MSLEKVRNWMRTAGRRDVAAGRSMRQKEVLDRLCRIALDLDGVVAHQGAKVGKGGEHLDLCFGRMVQGRKTPIVFCGLLMAPEGDKWYRRDPAPEGDTVRLYVKLSEPGIRRSPWVDLGHEDDGVKQDAEWRYVEIPDRIPVDGDEMLDLVEDAYFEVVGI